MLQGYNVIDFAGPLGLLCILIVGVGEIRRWLSSPKQAQYVLGAVFGLVAVIEMHMPITPFDGVIIDLRIVPVVLAGAFLGWRGLSVCMGMAIAARLQIGGAGALAGVAAVLLAGALGATWTRLTRAHLRRRMVHLVQLGLASCVTFASAIFLPEGIDIWFLKNAAPIMWMIYLVTIPIVGALIQRELRRIESELYMREGTSTCPETGLLRPASFNRETIQLSVNGPRGTVGGILVIWPIYANWLGTFWGSGLRARVQAAMAMVLVGRVTHADLIGLSRKGHLLVPLTAGEVKDQLAVTENLTRPLSQTELRLSSGQRFRVCAKLRVLAAGSEAELFDLLQSVDSMAPMQAPLAEKEAAIFTPPEVETVPHGRDSLFAKLEATLAVSRTDTVRLKD